MRKSTFLSASMYYENTIHIPHSRLPLMVQKGDIIRGHCKKVNMSTTGIEYRVTAVHHWGVYAVPTEKMIKVLERSYNKEYLDKMNRFKGHIKFKWCNIQGVIFAPSDKQLVSP